MQDKKLQIYKASAGSGKTFKLTEKYLLLAFGNPGLFRSILAVTFTNKAAGEMKGRVLEELDLLAGNVDEADHAQTLRAQFSQMSDKDIQKRAAAIRDSILHQYSGFAVSTIDSFVQKILRSFAYEIGAHTSYQIEMDMDKVVGELAEMLDKQTRKDHKLLEWLIRYATFRTDEGNYWDFSRDIKNLGKIIFSETFQRFSLVEHSLPNKEALKSMEDALHKIRYGFEKRMHDYGSKVLGMIRDHGLMQGNYGRDFNTFRNNMQRIAWGRAFKDFEIKPTVQGMIDGEKNWYPKKLADDAANDPAKQKAIDALEALQNQAQSVLEQITRMMQEEVPDYITAVAVLDNLHIYGILNDLQHLLPAYREENNVLLISDANLLLRNIVAGNDAPFIFEKTGNTFNHILIDEFQDTSHFQWDNFKPLVQNALGNGYYNLIVGDVKQSIYRWRGGDWNLLLRKVIQDIRPDNVQETTLEHNFRSHEQIIRLNNTVFHYAPQILQEDFNNEVQSSLSQDAWQHMQEAGLTGIFSNAYADSYQKPGKSDKTGGRIHMRFLLAKDQLKEEVAEKLPAQVDYMIREEGYKPGDIGILVRKNDESNTIRDWLLEYQQANPDTSQYAVVSPESLTLYNSPAVRLIVSAMHYLNNREEKIHLANLLHLYTAWQRGEQAGHQEFTSAATAAPEGDKLPEAFAGQLDELASLSVYEMTERLIRIFALDEATADQPYLAAFLDFALHFSNRDSADLAAFLEWWQESGQHKSVELPESGDTVQVLTIHKSKGLAFEVVILPFVNWKMDHALNPLIWCQADYKPLAGMPPLPVSYKKELAHSYFNLQYFTEKAYAGMDALNALYVAMTRAKREMHIYAGVPKGKGALNAGELLKQIMDRDVPDENGYYMSINAYYDQPEAALQVEAPMPDREKRASHVEKGKIGLQGKVGDWRSRLSIREKAREFFIEADEETRSRVDYGTVMHQVLARIMNPEDVDTAVQAAFFDGSIAMEDIPEIKQKIKDYMNLPQARDWFYGSWVVHPELPVLSSDGEQRIADRVLEDDEQIVVVDFKFGAPHSDYQAQVREYMKLLGQVFERPVYGYLYYPDAGKVDQVDGDT